MTCGQLEVGYGKGVYAMEIARSGRPGPLHVFGTVRWDTQQHTPGDHRHLNRVPWSTEFWKQT